MKEFKALLATVMAIFYFCIGPEKAQANLVVKRLYEDLFSDYNRWVLPVANNRSKVVVVLGLKLGQILDLNLKQQVLSTNVWVEQTWFDHKLSWDPNKYAGIEMIHVPAEELWIPDIVLFNNADGNYELNMLTKAKVFHTGMIEWKPPTMFKSTCEIDVEYFPFDVQSCLMRFGSWTYAGDEVEIQHKENKTRVPVGIDLSEFYKNVEWDIIEVPAQYNEQFYDCCTEPYPDITFKITIRRKILFYMVNLILPTGVMAFMTVFVFYLPSKSDEKVTLSISILISLIVFFLLMLEIIPASSLAVPLFGKYLLFTLVLVLLSTCVTVFVLNIHYRSPSVNTISPKARKLLLETLPYYLGIKRPDVVERSSLVRFRNNRARAIGATLAAAAAASVTCPKLKAVNNRVHPMSQNEQTLTCDLGDDYREGKMDGLNDKYVENEGRYFRRHVDQYRRCKHATLKTKAKDQTKAVESTSVNINKLNNNYHSQNLSLNDLTCSMVGGTDTAGLTLNGQKIGNIPSQHCDRLLPSTALSYSINSQLKHSGLPKSRTVDFTEPCLMSHPHASAIVNDNGLNVGPRMPNEDTLDTTFDYDDEDADLPSPPPPPQPLSQADPIDQESDDGENTDGPINDSDTNEECLCKEEDLNGSTRQHLPISEPLRNLCAKCYSSEADIDLSRDYQSEEKCFNDQYNFGKKGNLSFVRTQQETYVKQLNDNNGNFNSHRYHMHDMPVIDSLCQPYEQMPAHLRAAIRSILFIADTIKNEDVENNAIEDWNFMSMVIDRLFLWIFTIVCLCGSLMLLMFAPSLYDNRPSIDDLLRVDIPMTNCTRNHH
ncbi:Acetylcholine receptor subunit beta-like 2, partial [Fragariocoptes setiger]